MGLFKKQPPGGAMVVPLKSVFGKFALLCLASFLFVGSSKAEDNQKAALSTQLIELMQYKRMAADASRMCGDLEGSAMDPKRIFESNPNSFGGVSPKSIYWPDVIAAYTRYKSKLCAALSAENLASFYAREFEQKMSLDDLKVLVKFYSSPAGRRFSSTHIEVMHSYAIFAEKKMAEVSASAIKEADAEIAVAVAKYRKKPQ